MEPWLTTSRRCLERAKGVKTLGLFSWATEEAKQLWESKPSSHSPPGDVPSPIVSGELARHLIRLWRVEFCLEPSGSVPALSPSSCFRLTADLGEGRAPLLWPPLARLCRLAREHG